MNGLRIYSLRNAGVYVEAGGTGAMVDGLNKPTSHFDGVTDDDFASMMRNDSFIENCSFLLYTHAHQDHFDVEKNIRYISDKKPEAVFLPFSEDVSYRRLSECAVQNGTELISPMFGRDSGGVVSSGDVALRFFAAGHTGSQFAETPHYCLLLETGGYSIFVSGDVDHMSSEWHPPVLRNHVDIAFVSPFFINQETGRDFIAEMSPEKLFVYHLPPEELDEFRMRKQAETDLIKYRRQLEKYGAELVSSPMELIFESEKRS